MKKSALFIFLLVSAQCVLSQTTDSVTFCHNEKRELSVCKTAGYSLIFLKQAVKSFTTADSGITYDFDSRYFRMRKNDSIAITAKLDNESGCIIVEDKRNNGNYTRKLLDDSPACISRPITTVNAYSDSVMITFNYTYCRLATLNIVDVNLGSFNFAIYPCPGKNYYSWDIYFFQMDRPVNVFLKGVQVVCDRKNGEPAFINFCNDPRNDIHSNEEMAGIQILNTSKKANRFNIIQKAKVAKNSNRLVYEDLFLYDKKGKVTFSFAPLEVCQ